MTKVKELRSKLGLTQTAMGKLLGCNQRRCSAIEVGTDNRKATIQMQHHLAALEVLHDHGLIDQLFEKLEA